MRKQCKACPWRTDVDPHDIPNGYCPTLHADLADTIAKPAETAIDLCAALRAPLRIMACHESKIGREIPCVGWLANQLGPGNNIKLRLAARHDRSLTDFELVGEQHERFEDTLPTP